MLLVIGAVVLFSLLLPSLNRTMLYGDLNQVLTRTENSAMALAQGILSEAATKAFDEVCLTSLPHIAAQLTPISNLGSDAGEYYPNYDDLDDYASLSLLDTTAFATVPYTITATVDYMDPNNLSITSSSPTFVKRLRVIVVSPFLRNAASRDSLEIVLERIYAFY